MILTTVFKNILGSSPRKPGPQATPRPASNRNIPSHRDYVGGNWEKIGKLQFNYLVSQGLRPEHYLVDIACGSLRAGRFFIEYLEPEHYLGIDKEQWLIEAGVKEELKAGVMERKQPRLVVSSAFEFEKFGVSPDFAWAQSLFTHLTPPLILHCLKNLRACIKPTGAFYATIFESARPRENLPYSDDALDYWYTAREMQMFGEQTGWTMQYIGDWDHPRNQQMLKFTPQA